MKKFIILAALLVTTTAQASFLDDIFGSSQPEQVKYSKHSRSEEHTSELQSH